MDKELEMYYPAIAEYARDYQKYLKDFSMVSLPTGVPDLDRANMVASGNFVVIGAAPAMGKSAFTYMLLRTQMNHEIPVAYFTTENMNHPVAWTKLVNSLCGDIHDVCKSSNCYNNAFKEVPEMPLYIHSTPMLTVNEIKEHAGLLVNEYGVKVIFIDGIQSVALAEDSPTSDCIRKVCLQLKALAYKLRVPIVVTSDIDTNRINKGVGIDGKRPHGEDLKGCKYIKDIADAVVLLYRPKYYHFFEDSFGADMRRVVLAIIEKNIHGALLETTLRFSDGQISDIPDMDASKETITDEEMSREEAEGFINSSEVLKEFANKLNLEVSNQ